MGDGPLYEILYPDSPNKCGIEIPLNPIEDPDIPYLYLSNVIVNPKGEPYVTLPYVFEGASLHSACSPIGELAGETINRRGVFCVDITVHGGAIVNELMKKIPSKNGAFVLVDENGNIDETLETGLNIICPGKQLMECSSILAMDNGFEAIQKYLTSNNNEYTYLNDGKYSVNK